MTLNVDMVRRLGSLAYQLAKEMKRLRSIQTRTLALLTEANLPATDPQLAAEVVETLEGVLAHAADTMNVMQTTLAQVQQASDAGLERDCDD
jgi:hypothetical protein